MKFTHLCMAAMLKTVLLLTFFLLWQSNGFAQSIPSDSLYFGQTPPGDNPQIFAPGLISLPGRNEPCITFSPDGKSVFFYIEFYPSPGNPYILYTVYENDHWTAPDTISFSNGRACGEPIMLNNNCLYMFASNAANHHGLVDLCYSEKQGNTWSNPISLGNPPNSESYQYHPCIVSDTSIYFSSNTGYICRSQFINGSYQSRVVLPKPINYVGTQTWGDPYVSPNESYMIFKSIRPEGYGQHDIYIAYKKPDGSWTNPKNLGNKINTAYDETSGDITPDGHYMTYGSNKDLYWVSASFIDSLKYTNFIPYLLNLIPNQTDSIEHFFSYTIPDTVFIDDDGANTLSYSAKLNNGNSLPSWLAFDSISHNFSGTPTNAENLNIRVTVTDNAGATASTTFVIDIKNQGAIDHIKRQDINIIPNPSNGLIHLMLNTQGKKAMVEICNIEGKLLVNQTFIDEITIDMLDKPKGIYFVKLYMDHQVIIRKVCIIDLSSE